MRETAERLRKGSKALRDRFCARLTALGQSVAGLPKDSRAALDALDKPVAWTAKAESELGMELCLDRIAAKSGGAAAVPGETKAAPLDRERMEKLIKDLGGRFKKL